MDKYLNNRFRVFVVSFIPQSDTKPSRIKIKDVRENPKDNKGIIISKNGAFMERQAAEYLQKQGISVDAIAVFGNDYLLLSKDFGTRMK